MEWQDQDITWRLLLLLPCTTSRHLSRLIKWPTFHAVQVVELSLPLDPLRLLTSWSNLLFMRPLRTIPSTMTKLGYSTKSIMRSTSSAQSIPYSRYILINSIPLMSHSFTHSSMISTSGPQVSLSLLLELPSQTFQEVFWLTMRRWRQRRPSSS